MEWDKLYGMQQNLDKYIEDNHNLIKQETFHKRLLALLVELGELANETRCFKFWSTKPPSEKEVILEEYVDVLHFMLSLGIDSELRYNPKNNVSSMSNKNTTTLFLDLFQLCTNFGTNPNTENYNKMFEAYLDLGETLQFRKEDIEDMYFRKNSTNYRRQDQGY